MLTIFKDDISGEFLTVWGIRVDMGTVKKLRTFSPSFAQRSDIRLETKACRVKARRLLQGRMERTGGRVSQTQS